VVAHDLKLIVQGFMGRRELTEESHPVRTHGLITQGLRIEQGNLFVDELVRPAIFEERKNRIMRERQVEVSSQSLAEREQIATPVIDSGTVELGICLIDHFLPSLSVMIAVMTATSFCI